MLFLEKLRALDRVDLTMYCTWGGVGLWKMLFTDIDTKTDFQDSTHARQQIAGGETLEV